MDDLVQRLRDFYPHPHELEVVDEAADRIEAMTEQRDAARRDAVEAEAYATELEAKLAKAVKALKEIEWSDDSDWQADRARAALTEIGSDK